MATLEELMSEVMDNGSVKTASRRGGEDDDLAALAAELGADFSFDKESASKEEEEEEEEEEGKHASFSGASSSLYAQLYPNEARGLSKTAEQEKTAWQHEMGRATYRAYDAHFDQLIEKTAADILTGAIAIESPKGGDKKGNVHMDTTPSQQSATDKPKNSSGRIDLTPVYTDETAPVNDERTVGHYEAVYDEDSAKVASLALRKAFLLANLEE
jgi:hypothetical protein